MPRGQQLAAAARATAGSGIRKPHASQLGRRRSRAPAPHQLVQSLGPDGPTGRCARAQVQEQVQRPQRPQRAARCNGLQGQGRSPDPARLAPSTCSARLLDGQGDGDRDRVSRRARAPHPPSRARSDPSCPPDGSRSLAPPSALISPSRCHLPPLLCPGLLPRA